MNFQYRDGPVVPEQIQQVFAEKVKIAAQVYLREEELVLNHMELDQWLDQMAHSLVAHLRSVVLGKVDGSVDVDVKYPVDWWQAVRERWFPKRWLKRWPVKYKTISIHRQCWRVCPHVNVPKDNSLHWQFLVRGE